jgi:hypothetical protein
MTKRLILLFSIVGLILCLYTLFNWRPAGLNRSCPTSIKASIQQDPNAFHLNLVPENSPRKEPLFQVHFVSNSKPHCLNPTFPAIHIHTKTQHNAWIHIVYTDCPQWQIFIDAPSQTQPFYSWEQDFYDAPLWNYSLFHKPLSFWKGHVFAVQVGNKIVKCLGGVEWGFQLLLTELRPVSITPRLLGNQAWNQACSVLQKTYPQYHFLPL